MYETKAAKSATSGHLQGDQKVTDSGFKSTE